MAYVISDDCVAGDKYTINADECTECGTCASVCPSEVISLPE